MKKLLTSYKYKNIFSVQLSTNQHCSRNRQINGERNYKSHKEWYMDEHKLLIDLVVWASWSTCRRVWKWMDCFRMGGRICPFGDKWFFKDLSLHLLHKTNNSTLSTALLIVCFWFGDEFRIGATEIYRL